MLREQQCILMNADTMGSNPFITEYNHDNNLLNKHNSDVEETNYEKYLLDPSDDLVNFVNIEDI